MAWQNPKTDWSPEDGVTNDDFNRIEGNIALIKEANDRIAPNILANDVVVYVSTSGNDDSNSGQSGSPFRTINKALSTIPKNLSGRSAIINVSAGTYGEVVAIEGFDAPITINGVTGATVTINGLRVSGCICYIGNINLTLSGSVFITNGARLTMDGSITVNGYTITSNYGGHAVFTNVIINNVSSYAVEVNRGGYFCATNMSGSGNVSSIRSQSGGIACIGTNSMNVSGTQYVSASGGRIFTGSQQPNVGL